MVGRSAVWSEGGVMTLDQLELKNEGLSLTLEEQLNALTLCDLQSPDPKSSVSLNGTNFQAEQFESERGSSKVDALISMLRTIVPQKSVVVSQWTGMLKIVALHLKHLGTSYATIDGSINPKLRMDLVEDFNTNPRGAAGYARVALRRRSRSEPDRRKSPLLDGHALLWM
ncbi:unnamed protein product [Ranitomeya imitator]|uniref:Uncharacterized protein n=1 Tax=Ranitomeya imitator TaxID=111125 RepID=A0ABN9L5Y1_9NEOB|nr:unnamed protein product [Ranitomeya imitator]